MVVMSPRIPGIAGSGRATSRFDTLHSAPVAEVPQLFLRRLWNNVDQPAIVEPQLQRCLAKHRQRHVVAWQVDSLESVVLLEVAEAIALLLAVCEVRVEEERNLTFGA